MQAKRVPGFNIQLSRGEIRPYAPPSVTSVLFNLFCYGLLLNMFSGTHAPYLLKR